MWMDKESIEYIEPVGTSAHHANNASVAHVQTGGSLDTMAYHIGNIELIPSIACVAHAYSFAYN